MDFTNLVLAPLAAFVTLFVIIVSVFLRPRSEDRSLAAAFILSLMLNILIAEPWYYVTSEDLRLGLIDTAILSTIGFAVGALIALLVVKITRRLRNLINSWR